MTRTPLKVYPIQQILDTVQKLSSLSLKALTIPTEDTNEIYIVLKNLKKLTHFNKFLITPEDRKNILGIEQAEPIFNMPQSPAKARLSLTLSENEKKK